MEKHSAVRDSWGSKWGFILACIGCGLCVSICPEVFEIGDDGLAQPIQEVTETLEKTASQARESCPVNAIDLE